MTRKLSGNKVDANLYTIPISKGGTGADTAESAARNLRLITNAMKNIAFGVVGLDSEGRVDPSVLPAGVVFNGSNNVTGLKVLTTGQVSNYTITDYDIFTTYNLAVIGGAGSVSRSGATITYTAPGVIGNYGFTLNGKTFNVAVGSPVPSTPTISTPTNGATQISSHVNVISSAFSMLSGFDTHLSSDWQISSDAGFSTIVSQSIDDTTNKTSWTSGILAINTTYWIRVRYKGTTYGYGSYSSAVSFTTKATFTPNTEEANLAASDKTSSDHFGTSISISSDGTRVIVGSYLSDSTFVDAGAAYVFLRTGTSWSQEAKLVASDRIGGDNFGISVDITADSTRVAIGAQGVNANFTDTGAIYIFSRSGTTWTEETKIIAADRAFNDKLGYSVSISSDGTRVLGGAYGSSSGAGSAYMFSRSGIIWTQETKIVASNTAAGDQFGFDVAISSDGTRCVIGSRNADPGGITNAGAAYVFLRSGTTWTEERILSASDKSAGNLFGSSIDITSNGDRIIVGAQTNAPSGVNNAGAVYIYIRVGTTWTEEAKLTASDKATGDNFGFDVAISSDGTRCVIGAWTRTESGLTLCGAIYIFLRTGTTWSQEAKVLASDKNTGDRFGSSVAISSDSTRVAVGAILKDSGGIAQTGVAYIFN